MAVVSVEALIVSNFSGTQGVPVLRCAVYSRKLMDRDLAVLDGHTISFTVCN